MSGKKVELVQCIYCLEQKVWNSKKNLSEFNKEHVISKLLGLFGTETPTLTKAVCRICNNGYKQLEQSLGRDSIFGIILRVKAGILTASEFQESKKHKRKRIRFSILHSDHGHLMVELDVNSAGQFVARVCNQLIVMNSTKGLGVHFPPNQLPDRRVMEDMGLLPVERNIRIFCCTDDIPANVGLIAQSLQKARIKSRLACGQLQTNRFLPKPDQPVYISSCIDISIQRVVCKIAFNYLVFHHGNEVALNSCFDEIRNFVKHGQYPARFFMRFDEESMLSIVLPVKVSNLLHIVQVVKNSKQEIVAQVSLFGYLRFEIVLAISVPFDDLPSKKHIFDVAKKTISKLDTV